MSLLKNFGHLISNNRETDLCDREIGFVARITGLPGSCGEVHEGRGKKQVHATIALEGVVAACPVCFSAIQSQSQSAALEVS